VGAGEGSELLLLKMFLGVVLAFVSLFGRCLVLGFFGRVLGDTFWGWFVSLKGSSFDLCWGELVFGLEGCCLISVLDGK
jgi:hypothetical protein